MWIRFMRSAVSMLGLLALGSCSSGVPSSDRPHIVLIMADDMGYSDIRSYGGEIETPNLDSLAARGIRFTQFFNNGICKPTRSILMSGRYWRGNADEDVELPLIAEWLSDAGYATLAVGKWHLLGNPTDRGFDRYFGFLDGATDYFRGSGTFRLGDEKFIPPENGFYTTDAFADYAIRFVDEVRDTQPEKPIFLYLAFNAPHAPLQAPHMEIAKYQGKYLSGWDVVRDRRYQRQIELGIVKPEWPLSPRSIQVPSWDSLSIEEQRFEDTRMAVYAAMVDRMDQAIGKVLGHLDELGIAENTLVMFTSDNGANPFEVGRTGTIGEPGSRWRTGTGWANASNAPFRLYKRNSHNGGSAAPMIISWPGVLQEEGSRIDRPIHLVDLVATILEVSGAGSPGMANNPNFGATPNKSLVPILMGREPPPTSPIYLQLPANRAVIAQGWKLVSAAGGQWELYDLGRDRTELNDVALLRPKKRDELEQLWQDWWIAQGQILALESDTIPSYIHMHDPLPRVPQRAHLP